MKQRFRSFSLLGALLVPFAVTSASAQFTLSFDITDPSIIPDVGSSTFTANSLPAPPVNSVDLITVTLSHQWLGDLTIQVIPPTGSTFTLFERVGVTPDEPNGSAAILGGYQPGAGSDALFQLIPETYSFAASGFDFAAEAEKAAAGENSFSVRSDLVYGAQSWATGPFGAGTWQLIISDAQDLSGGEIGGAALMAPVPEPAGISTAVGLVLLVGAAVRRQARDGAMGHT